jgi:hypothetical protein
LAAAQNLSLRGSETPHQIQWVFTFKAESKKREAESLFVSADTPWQYTAAVALKFK